MRKTTVQSSQPLAMDQSSTRPTRDIRVLVVADRPGWCFSTRAYALKKFAPPGMTIDIVHYGQSGITDQAYAIYDVIFCLPPNKCREIRRLLEITECERPLVCAWNSGPGRPGYDIFDVAPHADWMIVNNYQSWVSALGQAKKTGGKFHGCHISNGVDLEIFRPIVPMESRPKRVLWMASLSKAEDERDVKGWKLVAEPLRDILKNRGVEVDFRCVEPNEEMSPEEMADWYNTGSVFVITSVSEGTPNVGLEAAACGCALVSTRVGNMIEIIRNLETGILVERNCSPPTPDFLRAVNLAMDNRVKFGRAIRQLLEDAAWGWEYRLAYYYWLFKVAAAGGLGAVNPFTYLALPREGLMKVDAQ
jgi:glycosyltransferase involved in cell wall biosynthesis